VYNVLAVNSATLHQLYNALRSIVLLFVQKQILTLTVFVQQLTACLTQFAGQCCVVCCTCWAPLRL